MTVILPILGGLIGALVLGGLAAILGDPLGAALGISDFEGGRGYFIAFVLIPAAALLGLVLGVWLTLRWRRQASPLRIIAVSVAIIGGIAAIIVAYVGTMVVFTDDLAIDGSPPRLEVEVRLPQGQSIPADPRAVRMVLYTEKSSMDAEFDPDDWRDEDEGRAVLRGTIDLYHRVPWRLIEVQLPARPTRVFQLDIPPHPPHMAAFGPWKRVGRIIPPEARDSVPAPADETTEMRVRVVWPGRE